MDKDRDQGRGEACPEQAELAFPLRRQGCV